MRKRPFQRSATPKHLAGAVARYVALMDWGSAAWGVQVEDLAVMSCGAVPFILEGYRERPLEEDSHLEARIVWRHL